MGHELNSREQALAGEDPPSIPSEESLGDPSARLDPPTAALVHAITREVAQHHAALRAAILFGSVARGEARPLDDPEPSDVDLLLVMDPTPGSNRLTREETVAVYRTVGEVEDRHREAPREVQITLVGSDLTGWDASFVENIARDGVLLWTRGALPSPLARLAGQAAEWAGPAADA